MVAANPQTAQINAALQQAVRHHQAGQLSEAERIYRGILQVAPDHLDASNNLSIALIGQGRLDEAVTVLRRIIAVNPDYVSAHSNLGNLLFQQGKPDEAEACYRRALALKPDMLDAIRNLGTAICKRGRFVESFPWFRRHAELAFGRPESTAQGQQPVPPYKARHDEEQRAYLNGDKGDGPSATFHLDEGERVIGRAVNPDQSSGDITAQWRNNKPQIAVIDNFLTDEALDALRRYCWRSTMWQKIYANGYLGAMPEHGFACPLLAQIDEELRSSYPAIIGQLPLFHWWGFKYDSRLAGTNIHADFAAVNVNFWITPDDANLDAESGGLVVWDKPAPLDWNFAQYNAGDKAIRSFLAQSGARSVKVPYRGNRAVIFDSDLFHETDRIAFKEGYLNRRINITMLYGRREDAAKPV